MSFETTPTPLCHSYCLRGLISNTGCTLNERSAKRVTHYPPIRSFSSGPSPLNRCGVTGWTGNYHRQKNRRSWLDSHHRLGSEERREEERRGEERSDWSWQGAQALHDVAFGINKLSFFMKICCTKEHHVHNSVQRPEHMHCAKHAHAHLVFTHWYHK